MRKYGLNTRVPRKEREAIRSIGYEPEKTIDQRALGELIKAAAEDGALEFNKTHTIRIQKEKEEKLGYATEYRYSLYIE